MPAYVSQHICYSSIQLLPPLKMAIITLLPFPTSSCNPVLLQYCRCTVYLFFCTVNPFEHTYSVTSSPACRLVVNSPSGLDKDSDGSLQPGIQMLCPTLRGLPFALIQSDLEIRDTLTFWYKSHIYTPKVPIEVERGAAPRCGSQVGTVTETVALGVPKFGGFFLFCCKLISIKFSYAMGFSWLTRRHMPKWQMFFCLSR